jgi:8-oxo-dGTP diphosphatase
MPSTGARPARPRAPAGAPPPVAQVAVGLLRDARGRVLIARRSAGQHLSGRWEFPGGKLHSGETPHVALARELAEELGIAALTQRPWLSVAHDYPAHAGRPALRVVLHARVVTRWRGRAHGREGQALRWAQPADIRPEQMPAANRALLAALRLPEVYQITGPCAPGEEGEFLRRLECGRAAGVRLVCLRCPGLPDADYLALARAALARLGERAQVLLHDRPHLVTPAGAHGVHLSARAAAALRARPAGTWVGASCHNAGELAAARALGADFAVLGPVRPTASHPGAPALGWARFAELAANAGLPVYALGGLHPGRAVHARRLGGQGVAVLGALWRAGPAMAAAPV